METEPRTYNSNKLKNIMIVVSFCGLLGLMFINMSPKKTAPHSGNDCTASAKNLDCFKKYLSGVGEYKTTLDISLAVKSLNTFCSRKPSDTADQKICYYSAMNNTFEKLDYRKFFLHLNHKAGFDSQNTLRAKEKRELDTFMRTQRAHVAKLYQAEGSAELKFRILQVIATIDSKTTELAKY